MRLIDADTIPYCEYDLDNYHSFCAVEDEVIAEMPTIEAEPVKHGQWNIIECDKEKGTVFVECECGAVFKLSLFDFGLCYNYCPNCGAKMDLED